MKKFVRNLLSCFVCFFSLVSIAGCSCSRPLKVHYTLKVSNETGSDEMTSLTIKVTTYTKYREPADTPCREKVTRTYTINSDKTAITYDNNKQISISDKTKVEIDGNTYIFNYSDKTVLKGTEVVAKIEDNKFTLTTYSLISKPDGVSKCYDANGNQFEKATYNTVDKNVIAEEYPVSRYDTERSEYVSSSIKFPDEAKYGLIYSIEIVNHEDVDLKIQTLDFTEIFGTQLKEDSLKDKVKIDLISDSEDKIEAIGNETYYVLPENDSITILIQMIGLTTKDSYDKAKEINLDFQILLKK